MELPQEIMMWYVVPAIRRALVTELKKKGLKQKEIAALLDITEPAVSQYVKDKRAASCAGCFPESFAQEITNSAERILKERQPAATMKEINRLCNFVKDKKILCEFHKAKDAKIKECDICYGH